MAKKVLSSERQENPSETRASEPSEGELMVTC